MRESVLSYIPSTLECMLVAKELDCGALVDIKMIVRHFLLEYVENLEVRKRHTYKYFIKQG